MNRSIVIASLLFSALIACGSHTETSASQSGADTSAASGSSDVGGTDAAPPPPPPPPASCVWQEKQVTFCDADTLPSDWEVQCRDVPCHEVNLDPDPIVAGDCSSYVEFQGEHDVKMSCSDWAKKGSKP